jgi:hypothetical protein
MRRKRKRRLKMVAPRQRGERWGHDLTSDRDTGAW